MTKLTALFTALLLAAGALLLPTNATKQTDDAELTVNIAESIGTVVEITEDYILIEDENSQQVQANLSSETLWEGQTPVAGDLVHILYNGMMTRSLPPQISAMKVSCYVYTGAVSNLTEESFILTPEDDLEQVQVNFTQLPEGLAEGSQVKVYFNGAMTMSLPAQIGAEMIVLLP